MNSKKFPLLNAKEESFLQDACYYMKMAELKKACQMLALPDKGNKGLLIERILTFIKEGRITTVPKIPAQSLAKNHPIQLLASSGLMLYGSYKNDAKTRSFFKTLIGPHFHFTAFGIDWLNDRWLQNNPPTYQEFAYYWIAETERRKHIKSKPKDEWKYINFLQQMNKEYPLLSKKNLMARWKRLQADKAHLAFKILESAIKKIC